MKALDGLRLREQQGTIGHDAAPGGSSRLKKQKEGKQDDQDL
jgi:hypothetical protein